MAEILLGNIKGEKGDTGNGLVILDYYSTLSELKTAIPEPSAGVAYGVGSGVPYNIYIYSPRKGWVNNGALQPNINEQAPNYAEAGTLESLTSGEKISIAFGKIKKAIKEFISHLANTSNPHGVTAEQIGAFSHLGGVIHGDSAIYTEETPAMEFHTSKNAGLIMKHAGKDEENNDYDYGLLLFDTEDKNKSDYVSLRLAHKKITDNDSKPTYALSLESVINGEAKYYNIYGDHNKPPSTYKGNGNAEGITVNIGGIGNALLIYGSGDSDGSSFIVTRSGAFGNDGSTPLAFSRDVIKFESGVLTIKTDSAYFNADSTYSYQVL
jgi:hypothetical protein